MQVIAYKCDRCGYISDRPMERRSMNITDSNTGITSEMTLDLCSMCMHDKEVSDTKWFYHRD